MRQWFAFGAFLLLPSVVLGQAPSITGFTPAEGFVGMSVTIQGTNLTGATSVRFAGVIAPISNVTATSVTTEVPAGASTGKIALTTPGGSATSADDFVLIVSGSPVGLYLVKDIRTVQSQTFEVPPMVVAGPKAYFTTAVRGSGGELWVTDGSGAGTTLLKDIEPGTGSSAPSWITASATQVFFVAQTTQFGAELYKSDGTAAGTVLVKDINSGPNGSQPLNLTVINGTLYFAADDGVNGVELWKSNGTAAGTVLVKDINPGVNGSSPGNFVLMNGFVYFSAYTDTGGFELWRTDGSSGGTSLVADIEPGAGSSSPAYLAANGTQLLFAARTTTSGLELWKSDGTAAGTVLVKDINTAGDGSPLFLTDVSGTIFFAADDGSGHELWKSDGSAAGTVMVKDIHPFGGSFPSGLQQLNGFLYFAATDDVHGMELWKSDGTTAGTVIVRDIDPSFSFGGPNNLTVANGELYFIYDDSASGSELWKSDGTSAGTQMVTDINAAGASSPSQLTPFGTLLLFIADDGVHGNQIWKTDGTAAGTVLVTDAGYASSDPQTFVPAGQRAFFSAMDDTHPRELWVSNGTPANTARVPGTAGGPSLMTYVNGTLYFIRSGQAVFRTDGTAAGTAVVMDGYEAPGLITFHSVVSAGVFLYFIRRSDVDVTSELWQVDSSTNTTALIQSFVNPDVQIVSAVDVNGTLYLTQSDGAGLYRISGGALQQVVSNRMPLELATVAGAVYFTAFSDSGSQEIYKWTEANGAVQLTSFNNPSGSLYGLKPVGNVVFFNSNDGTSSSLWKTDGTTSSEVKAITATNLKAAAGMLFFSGSDANGVELWRSDGTLAGTMMIRDINPGPAGSNPSQFIEINGLLYFVAEDGVSGREIWKSDGTPGGTVMMVDAVPGPGDLDPVGLTAVGSIAYFNGFTVTSGAEPYAIGTCAFTFSPASVSVAGTASSSSVTVTTASNCPWDVVSNESWITVTGSAERIGSGSVSYSVQANPSCVARTGTITIAGRLFVVAQAGGPPAFSISPATQSFTKNGGTGSVSVTTGEGCGWSAISSDAWLVITSNSSGNGSGTISYSVASNSGPARQATITIADKTFTAIQDAAVKAVTTTTLSSSPNPSNPSQIVTFTAAVSSAASGTITGSVAFMEGSTTLGTSALSGGSATFLFSGLPTGAHSIVAVYGGDPSFASSTSNTLVHNVAAPFGAPPNFAATATSTSTVELSWFPVAGATGYEVFRASSIFGPFTIVSTTSNSTVTDPTVSANATYLYRVRAIAASGASPLTPVDVATTVAFTDRTLVGVSIKAVHVLELRSAVNAMVVAAGFSPTTFTDTSLAGVAVKAVHVTELRSTLDSARSSIGLPAITYTDPSLAGIVVKGAHLQQLRDGTQ